MKLIGIVLIILGLFACWVGVDSATHGAHLPTIVNESIAPHISKALANIDDQEVLKSAQEGIDGIVGRMYVFIHNSTSLMFNYGADFLLIGILNILVGIYLLFRNPKTILKTEKG